MPGEAVTDMRVLVVEDDPTVGEVLRDLCNELGHDAQTVLTAEDAVVKLQERRPDLILLDFRLPRMSGLDFLRLPLVRDAGVPIIVVSGIATETQAQECLALGAVEFLAKPVPLDQLQRLLEWFDVAGCGMLGRRPVYSPITWMLISRRRGPSSSAKMTDWKRPRVRSPLFKPTAMLRPSSAAFRCEWALPRSQSDTRGSSWR